MTNISDSRARIPSHFRAALGERIRLLRNQAGFQQRALADLAGLRPDRLNKYETGSQPPPIFALSRIAQALSRPVDLFLPGLQLSSPDDQALYEQILRLWSYPADVRQGLGKLLRSLCDSFDKVYGPLVEPTSREARHAPRR